MITLCLVLINQGKLIINKKRGQQYPLVILKKRIKSTAYYVFDLMILLLVSLSLFGKHVFFDIFCCLKNIAVYDIISKELSMQKALKEQIKEMT